MRRSGTNDGVGRQFFGCLAHRLIVGKYESGFDRGLSFGAAFEQAALDKKAISALSRARHFVLLLKLQGLGSGTMFHTQVLAVLGRNILAAACVHRET